MDTALCGWAKKVWRGNNTDWMFMTTTVSISLLSATTDTLGAPVGGFQTAAQEIAPPKTERNTFGPHLLQYGMSRS
jgi:hypothetical protein